MRSKLSKKSKYFAQGPEWSDDDYWNHEEKVPSKLYDQPNNKDGGYEDDDRFFQPHRYLKNWFISKPGCIKSNRKELPDFSSAQLNRIYLYGELESSKSKRSKRKPFPVFITGIKSWSFDRHPVDRGLWIQSKRSWYKLKQPCIKEITLPNGSKISQDLLHVPIRAKFGLLSNVIDMMCDAEGALRKDFVEFHSRRNPLDSHAHLCLGYSDLLSQPWLIKEPFDVELLKREPTFVKYHLKKLDSLLSCKSEFMKGLTELEKPKKRKKRNRVDDYDYLASAEMAEMRSDRLPWGCPREHGGNDWENPMFKQFQSKIAVKCSVSEHLNQHEDDVAFDDDLVSVDEIEREIEIGKGKVGDKNDEVENGDTSEESDEDDVNIRRKIASDSSSKITGKIDSDSDDNNDNEQVIKRGNRKKSPLFIDSESDSDNSMKGKRRRSLDESDEDDDSSHNPDEGDKSFHQSGGDDSTSCDAQLFDDDDSSETYYRTSTPRKKTTKEPPPEVEIICISSDSEEECDQSSCSEKSSDKDVKDGIKLSMIHRKISPYSMHAPSRNVFGPAKRELNILTNPREYHCLDREEKARKRLEDYVDISSGGGLKEGMVHQFIDEVVNNDDILSLEMILVSLEILQKSKQSVKKKLFNTKNSDECGARGIFIRWMDKSVQIIMNRRMCEAQDKKSTKRKPQERVEENIVVSIVKLFSSFDFMTKGAVEKLKELSELDFPSFIKKVQLFSLEYDIGELSQACSEATIFIESLKAKPTKKKTRVPSASTFSCNIEDIAKNNLSLDQKSSKLHSTKNESNIFQLAVRQRIQDKTICELKEQNEKLKEKLRVAQQHDHTPIPKKTGRRKTTISNEIDSRKNEESYKLIDDYDTHFSTDASFTQFTSNDESPSSVQREPCTNHEQKSKAPNSWSSQSNSAANWKGKSNDLISHASAWGRPSTEGRGMSDKNTGPPLMVQSYEVSGERFADQVTSSRQSNSWETSRSTQRTRWSSSEQEHTTCKPTWGSNYYKDVNRNKTYAYNRDTAQDRGAGNTTRRDVSSESQPSSMSWQKKRKANTLSGWGSGASPHARLNTENSTERKTSSNKCAFEDKPSMMSGPHRNLRGWATSEERVRAGRNSALSTQNKGLRGAKSDHKPNNTRSESRYAEAWNKSSSVHLESTWSKDSQATLISNFSSNWGSSEVPCRNHSNKEQHSSEASRSSSTLSGKGSNSLRRDVPAWGSKLPPEKEVNSKKYDAERVKKSCWGSRTNTSHGWELESPTNRVTGSKEPFLENNKKTTRESKEYIERETGRKEPEKENKKAAWGTIPCTQRERGSKEYESKIAWGSKPHNERTTWSKESETININRIHGWGAKPTPNRKGDNIGPSLENNQNTTRDSKESMKRGTEKKEYEQKKIKAVWGTSNPRAQQVTGSKESDSKNVKLSWGSKPQRTSWSKESETNSIKRTYGWGSRQPPNREGSDLDHFSENNRKTAKESKENIERETDRKEPERKEAKAVWGASNLRTQVVAGSKESEPKNKKIAWGQRPHNGRTAWSKKSEMNNIKRTNGWGSKPPSDRERESMDPLSENDRNTDTESKESIERGTEKKKPGKENRKAVWGAPIPCAQRVARNKEFESKKTNVAWGSKPHNERASWSKESETNNIQRTHGWGSKSPPNTEKEGLKPSLENKRKTTTESKDVIEKGTDRIEPAKEKIKAAWGASKPCAQGVARSKESESKKEKIVWGSKPQNEREMRCKESETNSINRGWHSIPSNEPVTTKMEFSAKNNKKTNDTVWASKELVERSNSMEVQAKNVEKTGWGSKQIAEPTMKSKKSDAKIMHKSGWESCSTSNNKVCGWGTEQIPQNIGNNVNNGHEKDWKPTRIPMEKIENSDCDKDTVLKSVLGSCLTSTSDEKKEKPAKRKVISDSNNGGESVIISQERERKQIEEASNASVVSNVSALTRNKYDNDTNEATSVTSSKFVPASRANRNSIWGSDSSKKTEHSSLHTVSTAGRGSYSALEHEQKEVKRWKSLEDSLCSSDKSNSSHNKSAVSLLDRTTNDHTEKSAQYKSLQSSHSLRTINSDDHDHPPKKTDFGSNTVVSQSFAQRESNETGRDQIESTSKSSWSDKSTRSLTPTTQRKTGCGWNSTTTTNNKAQLSWSSKQIATGSNHGWGSGKISNTVSIETKISQEKIPQDKNGEAPAQRSGECKVPKNNTKSVNSSERNNSAIVMGFPKDSNVESGNMSDPEREKMCVDVHRATDIELSETNNKMSQCRKAKSALTKLENQWIQNKSFPVQPDFNIPSFFILDATNEESKIAEERIKSSMEVNTSSDCQQNENDGCELSSQSFDEYSLASQSDENNKYDANNEFEEQSNELEAKSEDIESQDSILDDEKSLISQV